MKAVKGTIRAVKHVTKGYSSALIISFVLIFIGVITRFIFKNSFFGLLIIVIGALVYLWYLVHVPNSSHRWHGRGL